MGSMLLDDLALVAFYEASGALLRPESADPQ